MVHYLGTKYISILTLVCIISCIAYLVKSVFAFGDVLGVHSALGQIDVACVRLGGRENIQYQ